MNKILLLVVISVAVLLNLNGQDYNLTFRSHISFPNETTANICGYAQNGREYALVGNSKGMRIVDVTNPDVPTIITQIPVQNPSDSKHLWKEIKVWKHYAYVTSEAIGFGLQIVDLSGLPNNSIPYVTYYGDGAIDSTLSQIHALHIDTTAGFVHLYGCTMADGTAIGDVVCDLKQDPMTPVYVGKWATNYIHDGYVDNDTLYGSHIYSGYFSIIDFHDKTNPQLLGLQHTPGNFTHNTWITKDRKHLLTTDEVSGSYLTSYDISDPTDIKELDRIQPTPGSGSFVHNTHIKGDFAITSWYRDGVTIVDCSHPDNLIQTAWYDAYPQASGNGENGTWGVYPFLPSGNLVLSNIEDGLYVLTPTYKKACFLEGLVTNAATSQPLSGVDVALAVPNFLGETSKTNGVYKTGHYEAGSYQVVFSKSGFISQTFTVSLVEGQVTTLDVQLVPQLTISGKALETGTNANVEGAKIVFHSASAGDFEAISDATGDFVLSGITPGNYTIFGGKWGYLHTSQTVTLPVSNLKVFLSKGYQDDFFADFGWTNTFTATTGFWTRAVPNGTSNNGNQCNPGADVDGDLGSECYDTGNAGGTAAADDVDGGEVVLISPSMKLLSTNNPTLSFHYWFFNGGGTGTPNDKFTVKCFNGLQEVTVFTTNQSQSNWRFSDSIRLADFLTITDDMTVSFITADDAPGHLVEAAVDAFFVGAGKTIGTENIDFSTKNRLKVYPNPFSERVFFEMPSLPEGAKTGEISICNLLMQPIKTEPIDLKLKSGKLEIGSDLPAGTYFIGLKLDGKLVGEMEKLVRQ